MLCASLVHARGLKLHQQPGVVAGNFDFAFALGALTCRFWPLFVCLFGVNGSGIAAPQLVAAFAAHGFDIDLFIGIAADELVRRLEDVGVECARKSLVAADHDEQHALLRPRDEKADGTGCRSFRRK